MLVFNSQRPAQVAPLVEERLRKELGASAPLPYTVQVHDDLVCTLRFALPGPRPARLRVRVGRHDSGSYVGELLYAAQLTSAITGPLQLEAPHGAHADRFGGPAASCARLNADADLLALVCRIVRAEADLGSVRIVGQRLCRLLPRPGGAVLILGTLPRVTALGFAHLLDAPAFLDLAARIEATL